MANAFVIPSIFTAIDRLSGPVNKMGNTMSAFQAKMQSTGKIAMDVAKKSALIGTVIAAPLILAANEAVKFEDRMADVGKTTQLIGKPLEILGNQILALAPKTRTSIEELQKIAAIGGQMGIQGGGNILKFVESIDKFNVALGSDFTGGVEEASKSIAVLRNLFKETRGLDISDAITKTGSAINAISAKGVNVPELTDFISRIGQLPDAIKPSITATAALGAILNKAGITSEIGARGLSDILIVASQNLPLFAKQMKLTQVEASNLINTKPEHFLTKFAASLKDVKGDKLGNILKNLKIGDTGAIKVVGALSTSTKQLEEYLTLLNAEYNSGTSLLNEYNTKNNTTAANLEKAKNNFQALAVIIGTQLLPALNDLLITISPMIISFSNWAKDNPTTMKTILGIAVVVSALSFAISIGSTLLFVYTKAALAISWILRTWAAAQYVLNVAMNANPIGAIIVGIALLIGFVVLIINKWNEWGAAMSFLLGPLGFVISLVQSFRRNWDGIKKAFAEGGILAGIKKIGAVILDAILMPLQQVLKLIAKVTGAEWAQNAVDNLQKFREDLGVNVSTDESGKPLINPAKERQDALAQTVSEQTNNARVDMYVNDPGKYVKVKSNSPFVNINTTSTMGFN